jgi:hypothetical protein
MLFRFPGYTCTEKTHIIRPGGVMDMTAVNLPSTALIEDLLRESGSEVKCPLEFEHLRVEPRGEDRCLYHITLRCSGIANMPPTLLLKTDLASPREAHFYQMLGTSDLPVPHCYAVRLGSPNLILTTDLSSTHTDLSDWPNPLPLQATRDVLEALAEFHAHYWDLPCDSPLAACLPIFLHDRAAYDNFINHLRHDFEIYAHSMGSLVEPAHLRLYHSVLTFLPTCWDEIWVPRIESGRKLPLIHGDLGPANILYPHGGAGKVVFTNWETHRRGLPTSDLAMLLGCQLSPLYEDALPLLKVYHAALLRHGVKAYSFNDLLDDYQIALLFELFYPLQLFVRQGFLNQTMIDNAVLALESFSDSLG